MQSRRHPRADTHPVKLTREERKYLETLTSQGEQPVRVLKRARILLLLHDGWAPVDVPEAVGAGEATVRRVRRRYEEGGMELALYEKHRPGPERHVTARHEARIVAMVCSSPPRGRSRWTVRLIVEEAVRRKIVKNIGRETIRLLLANHDLKPWREKNVVRERTR